MKGPVVTTVVALAAMVGVVGAFMSSASPYVTIAQARASKGDRLHLIGDIVKDTVSTDLATHTLSFRLKDPTGAVVQVKHLGEPPANMGSATRLVAVGSMHGDEFVSEQLLLKCPSKYEGETKLSNLAQR